MRNLCSEPVEWKFFGATFVRNCGGEYQGAEGGVECSKCGKFYPQPKTLPPPPPRPPTVRICGGIVLKTLAIALLLTSSASAQFTWRITETVAEVAPDLPKMAPPVAVSRPRVVFLTLPGCAPCKAAHARLATLDRAGIDWATEDLRAWNARVGVGLQARSAPTVFLWRNPGKAGARLEGAAITLAAVRSAIGTVRQAGIVPRRVVTKSTVRTSPDGTVTHMQRMRAKYGWIPSSHCGRRGCSMCDEIFGGRPAKTRRLFNRWGSVTPKFLPNYEDFNPTPMVVVNAAVKLAGLTAADTFVDLGCGDGRMLAAGFAAGAGNGIGVERNPRTAMIAHENTLAHDCEIIVGDITAGPVDLTGKKVFVYLYPQALERIPNLDRAAMVVSFCHRPPQLPGAKEVELFVDDGDPFTVFVWERDA